MNAGEGPTQIELGPFYFYMLGWWTYGIDKLKMINCGNYFTVININGKHENHAHVKKYSTAHLLVKLINKKLAPKSPYLRESVKRITLDDKYIQKIEIKEEKIEINNITLTIRA